VSDRDKLIEQAKRTIRALDRGVIDDSDELLIWLVFDVRKIMEDYVAVVDELQEARRKLERIASAVVENEKKVAFEYDWCNFCECHPSSGHAEDCAVQICEEIVGGER
jgi:hypothetical protein